MQASSGWCKLPKMRISQPGNSLNDQFSFISKLNQPPNPDKTGQTPNPSAQQDRTEAKPV